jgi:hypothetical protein
MKKHLVIAVGFVLVLSGCSALSTTPGNPASSVASPTAAMTLTPDPGESAAVDPNENSGATPSDGQGDAPVRSQVLWGDYPSGTQADIDALTAAGDCKSLDSQYGSAVASEAKVMASSGHDAEAILTYIDEARVLGACD